MPGNAQLSLPQLPEAGLRDYIISLAAAYGVSYVKTKTDKMAEAVTRLAGDEVNLDEVEQLLIALERAGVVASTNVVPLHIKYLREKLHV